MKIYLLNPPFLPRFVRCGRWQGGVARGRTLYYPIWLAYAAGLLEKAGRTVRLIDAPARRWGRQDVLDDLAEFRPDLAVVDSNFASLSNDMDIARSLKEAVPALVTVMVGPPASQFAERMLDSTGVDIVARLEYEFTLQDIARTLESGSDLADVKGISYRKDNIIRHNPDREFAGTAQLDSLPFVSSIYQRHLNVLDYSLDHTLYPEVQVFTGRGCPNLCTFCSWPETMMGRNHRARSVPNVVDEFEYVEREMPQVREIFIEDDTFTIDRKRVAAICEEIGRRNLKVTWSCNARANLDYETMKLMKKAGCRLLDVGYESGSDVILKNVKKGISTERMHEFSRDARKAGLMVLGDFVFGLPGETRHTAEQTMRFAHRLKPNMAQFAVATPLPGTEFYRWAKANDFLLIDDLEKSLDKGGFQRCIISYPEFSHKDVETYVDKALKSYYLSPSYAATAFRNIFRRNGWHELKGIVRSAGLFFSYLRRER